MISLSEAVKVFLKIWKHPSKGLMIKRKFDREVSLHEVFLEAVPSALVMMVIRVSSGPSSAFALRNIVYGTDDTIDDWTYDPRITNLYLGGNVFFYLTFSTSVFSASLGLAKCLLVGPARIMTQDAPASGLLSGRFIFALLASASCLVSKGVILGLIVYWADTLKLKETFLRLELTSFYLFIPELTLATILIMSMKKTSMKMLLYYPSLLLMPVFTMFTFSKIKSGCCGEKDERIAFSVKYTFLNIFITIV